jgi:hypothetical protein
VGFQSEDTAAHTLPIAAAFLVLTSSADAPNAEEVSPKLSSRALQEIVQVEAEIDRIEAQNDRAARGATGQSDPANRVARQGDAVR